MSVMRRTIVRYIKQASYASRLHAVLRRVRPAQHTTILRYHSIGKASSLISKGITVSPEAFEDHVRYFSKHFRTISMSVLVDCVQNQQPVPENALVWTFDDGFADNYHAAKILHQYGLTGLFYITAGCIETEERFWVAEVRHLLSQTERSTVCLAHQHGMCQHALTRPQDRAEAVRSVTHLLKTVTISERERIREELRHQLEDTPPFPGNLMLTWRQLRDMVAMGMEIGGHTMTHCNLPSATNEEAWFEISQCQVELEKQLEANVRHFAYPNGGSVQHYNDHIKELVRRAGFLSASTSKPGLAGLDADLLELLRIRPTEHLSEMTWEMEAARSREFLRFSR